jgi:hypothetical protein
MVPNQSEEIKMNNTMAWTKHNNIAAKLLLQHLITEGSVFPFISDNEHDSDSIDLWYAALESMTTENMVISGYEGPSGSGRLIYIQFDYDGNQQAITYVGQTHSLKDNRSDDQVKQEYANVRLWRFDQLEEMVDFGMIGTGW